MHHTVRARLGTAALLVSALGLVAPAAAPSNATVPTSHPAARAAAHHLPTLTFKITKAHAIKLVRGPRTFRPGRVAFRVTSADPNATVEFARFVKGYGYQAFRKDLTAVFTSNNMRALKRAIAHTTLYGGPGTLGPQVASGTVVLPKAGTYTVYNGGDVPKRAVTLHAVGRPQHRAAPRTSGTLTALTGIRFGGQRTIPRRGTLLLKNRASDSPHMFVMNQVQPGTTKKQVVDYVRSGSQAPPPWGIGPGPASEVVSPHQAMTLNYRTAPGRYALMCFFPDPNNHGMPHAAMGMVRMLTVK